MNAELPPQTVPSERLQTLAAWLANTLWPQAGVSPDGPEVVYEPRDYQLESWAKLEDTRAAGQRRALGNLATGLGKTFVALVDAIRFTEECRQMDPPLYPNILYVSHKHEINEQAAETAAGIWKDAELAFFDTRKPIPDAHLTFATVQGLYTQLSRFRPTDYEYIIWDEGHHLEATTFKKVRDFFRPLFAHAITATLERSDSKDITTYFGRPLYEMDFVEGIVRGHLADVDYHVVLDDTIKALLEQEFQSTRELQSVFDIPPRNEAIAKSIREEQHALGLDEARTMVFCKSIGHAEEMAALLGGTAYHSDIKKDERKQIRDAFSKGGLHTICTVDMFNEGVDIPAANLLVFLRSTQSSTIFLQQLGRGLRKIPGSKEKVTVFDYVANINRIKFVLNLSNDIVKRSVRVYPNGDEGEPEGDNRQSSQNGFAIRARHGDFNFSKTALDLLTEFERLQTIPEGMYSLARVAREKNIDRRTLDGLIAEKGWQLPKYTFGSTTASAISAEQLAELEESYPDNFLPPLPDGYFTKRVLCKELGITHKTLQRITEGFRWTVLTFKVGGYVCPAYSPAQVAQIRKHEDIARRIEQRGMEAVPISAVTLAREFNITARKLKEFAEKLGHSSGRYTFGSKPGDGFTAQQAKSIRESMPPPIETGWRWPRDCAAELEVTFRALCNIVDELGLDVEKRRGKGRGIDRAFSPQQIAQIKASSRYKQVKSRQNTGYGKNRGK